MKLGQSNEAFRDITVTLFCGQGLWPHRQPIDSMYFSYLLGIIMIHVYLLMAFVPPFYSIFSGYVALNLFLIHVETSTCTAGSSTVIMSLSLLGGMKYLSMPRIW